jgi:hypothetical protein
MEKLTEGVGLDEPKELGFHFYRYYTGFLGLFLIPYD